MLMDGLRPALLGLGFGLAAGAAVVQLIRSVLYETQPLDPAVFIVGVVSHDCWFQASLASCQLGASRLDPMQALRTE